MYMLPMYTINVHGTYVYNYSTADVARIPVGSLHFKATTRALMWTIIVHVQAMYTILCYECTRLICLYDVHNPLLWMYTTNMSIRLMCTNKSVSMSIIIVRVCTKMWTRSRCFVYLSWVDFRCRSFITTCVPCRSSRKVQEDRKELM